ncbi:MAG: biopolymer transporter ExbD [Selenomonadaceae bacterium]|nr:biopolymer transporter ExbD [Selenomonadaceae bacterium]
MRRNFHEVKEPAVMIIPMIDIMLFLLVFFMVSSIFMVQSNTIQVNLPAASQAKRDTRPNIVPVAVAADGTLQYKQETIGLHDLPAKVKESLLTDAETVFVLRGDKKTPYENVVSVLDVLKRSGTRHVSIATERKE